jgi:hypothetical protein
MSVPAFPSVRPPSRAGRRGRPLRRPRPFAALLIALVVGVLTPASTAASAGGQWNEGWVSGNWAGYIVTDGPYTSVSGQWTVPSVSTSQSGYSAVWLGVDGVDNNHLIQVGTEQDSFFGHAHYAAWWEILPAPAVEIDGYRVRPGDRITASVKRVSANRWQIRISNATHWTYTTTRTYTGRGTSAEWIVEAPTVNSRQSQLARHGPVRFDHLLANGRNPKLDSSESGVLVQFHRQIVITSAPDAQRDGFTVSRV